MNSKQKIMYSEQGCYGKLEPKQGEHERHQIFSVDQSEVLLTHTSDKKNIM